MQSCLEHDWSEYFVAQDVAQAYEALYTNVDGIGDAWASMWTQIATTLQGNTGVLGFELINEPWVGDQYKDPALLLPWPSPTNGDRVKLQPAYDRINKAVREVDDDVLIFFAGSTFGDLGSGFTHPPGGSEYANRSVLSYHYVSAPLYDFSRYSIIYLLFCHLTKTQAYFRVRDY